MGDSTMAWIPIVFSALSLLVSCYALYANFWQGPKLSSSVDKITILRIPTDNRIAIARDVIASDLLSKERSEAARLLIEQSSAVAEAVKVGDRSKVIEEMERYFSEKKMVLDLTKLPTDLVLNHPGFVTNFYLPMMIRNFGRKMAFVSSLVLVMRSEENKEKKWAFTVFTEIDAKKLLPGDEVTKDRDMIKSMFFGLSVPPLSSVDVHPWYIPIFTLDKKPISEGATLPGKYELSVMGYGADGNRIFTTSWIKFEITLDQLMHAMGGAASSNFVAVDRDIKNALTVS